MESWLKILDKQDVSRFEERLEIALNGQLDFDIQYQIHTQSGKLKTIQAMGLVEFDGDKNPIKMVGVNWDISRQKSYEQYLEKNAYLDPLTHIANRRQFDKTYKVEWCRAAR